jgi:hypothetical protein
MQKAEGIFPSAFLFYESNAYLVIQRKKTKSVAESMTVTGSVKIHAITIFLTVPPCKFLMPRLATIVSRPSDSATIHISHAVAKSVTPAIPLDELGPKLKKGAFFPAVTLALAHL